MLSAPAGLLPACIPVDPGLGLFNWPPPVLPSGPVIHLSGSVDFVADVETERLLHEAIFSQRAPILPAGVVIDQLERARQVVPPPLSDTCFINVTATLVEDSSGGDPGDTAPATKSASSPADLSTLRADPAPSETPIGETVVDDRPTVSALSDISRTSVAGAPIFEYASTHLTLLPPGALNQLSRLVERMMDHAVNYLLAQESATDLRTANQNFTFGLQQLKGESPRGRSPATAWQNVDSPDRQAQKAQRFLKLLRECVAATIMPGQIDTSLNSYVYSDDAYRYVFREWYGGDAIIVQMRTPGGYSTGRMAFTRQEVEAARQVSAADWKEQKDRTERNRSPFKGDADGSVGRIQDRIDGLNQKLKHSFFGADQKASGGNA
jgi:hypothetical protein